MLAGAKLPLVILGGGALAVFVLFALVHLPLPVVGGQFAFLGTTLARTEGLAARSLGSLDVTKASAASGTATPAAGSISCRPSGPNSYEQCWYTDNLGQTMKFFLFVPAPFEPHQKYPLVLVLHGGGERARPGMTPAAGNALLEHAPYVKCWVGKPAHLNDPSVQSRWPSFVVVPQLDGLSRWVDVPPSQGSYKMAARPTAELRMAKEIVDLLRQKYANVDSNRLYITGISLGGYGTWDAIERWPGYFAAAVAVSGGGDPSKAYLLKDMPIWVFHGSMDPIVPVSGSRDMIKAIEAAGGHPRYTEYAGAKHDIWARVYAVDTVNPSNNVFQWLFSQHKNPVAKLPPGNRT